MLLFKSLVLQLWALELWRWVFQFVINCPCLRLTSVISTIFQLFLQKRMKHLRRGVHLYNFIIYVYFLQLLWRKLLSFQNQKTKAWICVARSPSFDVPLSTPFTNSVCFWKASKACHGMLHSQIQMEISKNRRIGFKIISIKPGLKLCVFLVCLKGSE